jgi:hypothetical protein
VPADLIDRLLRERPRARASSCPACRRLAGMESPGQAPEPYQVLLFDRSGNTAVFASR